MKSKDGTAKDRRFISQEWDQPFFCEMKDFYLLTSDLYKNWLDTLLPPSPTKDFVLFSFKNILDALSPSNFPWTNPEILKKTLQTNGGNLQKGLENLSKDLANPKAFGLPPTTQLDHFRVGENLASTPGTVVFENELCQLIFYKPQTEKIFDVPLLIIPPWINKFYIFDLSESNSFVKWNVEQGRPVFLLSWVNPNQSHKDFVFEDYLLKGIDTCIDFIIQLTQSSSVNVLGLCVSGTALLSLLGYYAKVQQASKISSATLLATPVDFSHLKGFKPFVNHEMLKMIESLSEDGIIPGKIMVYLFFFLRANELVWSHYIHQYLMGEDPPVVDFLYWNSDPLNIIASMHLPFLQKFFIENALMSGPLTVLNQKINIEDIKTPIFSVGTLKDHISPWPSVYAIKEKIPHAHFVLGGSGHIAGIINPPSQNKYGYFTNTAPSDSFAHWQNNATQHLGSWWEYWNTWMKTYDGLAKAPLFTPPFIEEAPGRYVK
jgi:polyhydroxyalkanoate synthase